MRCRRKYSIQHGTWEIRGAEVSRDYPTHSVLLRADFVISQVPLEKYFPELNAGPDINEAIKYILRRVMQANHTRLSTCLQ